MSKISILQLDQAGLALAIQQYSSGAAFSGNFVNYVANSGWLGNNVVSTTGGAQIIVGSKVFTSPIGVPYAGGTGESVAQLYVTNQIAALSGILNNSINFVSGAVESGNSAFTVTGSSVVNVANITGLGGTQVILSGGQLFISGAGSVGGGASVQVTGSSAISAPNFTGLGSVTLSYNGTYVIVSGAATSSTAGAPNAVFQTGDQNISGQKIFTGSPLVASPTLPSGATNILYVSGVSGGLMVVNGLTSGVLNFQMTGASGILSARDLAISGALQAQIVGGGGTTSNFAITGTGTINVTLNASGTMTNTISVSGNMTNIFNATGVLNNTFNGPSTNNINISGVTGNFVNISFYFDQYNLFTGTNQIEVFVARNFFFTGYAIGAINSGTQGFFSGSLYQRSATNVKTNFIDFSLNSGQFFTGVGGFVQIVSGLNRVGLDIYRIGTGITGLSVGIFGVGY